MNNTHTQKHPPLSQCKLVNFSQTAGCFMAEARANCTETGYSMNHDGVLSHVLSCQSAVGFEHHKNRTPCSFLKTCDSRAKLTSNRSFATITRNIVVNFAVALVLIQLLCTSRWLDGLHISATPLPSNAPYYIVICYIKNVIWLRESEALPAVVLNITGSCTQDYLCE